MAVVVAVLTMATVVGVLEEGSEVGRDRVCLMRVRCRNCHVEVASVTVTFPIMCVESVGRWAGQSRQCASGREKIRQQLKIRGGCRMLLKCQRVRAKLHHATAADPPHPHQWVQAGLKWSPATVEARLRFKFI